MTSFKGAHLKVPWPSPCFSCLHLSHFLYVLTQAALMGGTTMVMAMVLPEQHCSLVDAYENCRALADAKVCCDYALHVGVTWWGAKVSNTGVKRQESNLHISKAVVLFSSYTWWWSNDGAQSCFISGWNVWWPRLNHTRTRLDTCSLSMLVQIFFSLWVNKPQPPFGLNICTLSTGGFTLCPVLSYV